MYALVNYFLSSYHMDLGNAQKGSVHRPCYDYNISIKANMILWNIISL